MATCLTSTSRMERVSAFLGLQRNTVGLLAMVVLVGMGERIGERFLPIYILALGGGAVAIGLLQAMDNFLSALCSLPGGVLAERIGIRRALVVFDLMAMTGFVIVIAVPTWKALLAGAALFISWSAISLPATIALLYHELPVRKRTMGVTMHSLVRRIPMAVGPLIGGLLIARLGERDGVRAAFVTALCMATAGLLLQLRMIEDDRPDRSRPSSPAMRGRLRALAASMSPSLKHLLGADILIRFSEQIPYAFVVVWCMKTIVSPVTAPQFGVLTSIEMATAVLVYVPVAWLADRGRKKSFVLATFVFFTLFPLVLMQCESMASLVPAFVLRGLKEFGEPTRKALIMDLAPPDCQAVMFGFYYLVRDSAVTLAALGGALLWEISPSLNLTTAFACGAAGTLGFAVLGRTSDAVQPGSAH